MTHKSILRANGRLARFEKPKTDVARSRGLAADHPAVLQGRTLFPGRVKPVAEAKHFLISGHSNSKIGKVVLKGPWQGMPIYTLTLEERATCPRSCLQYRDCYGSAMQWPARWDHRDADFMDFLRAEIITKCREHPDGLVVRLHVLGDFYSFEYVRMWVELIDRFPQLHVYGYTARREDDDDDESRRMAAGLRRLSERCWDQFAIRFSRGEPGYQHTIVVDEDPQQPDVIVCPAQKETTETCGTCGLCWSPSARGKTIAFLRHGMKPGRVSLNGKPRGRQVKMNAEGLTESMQRTHAAMLALADERGVIQKTIRTISDAASVSSVVAMRHIKALSAAGYVQVLRQGRGPHPAVYRAFATKQADYPPPVFIAPRPMKPSKKIRDRDPRQAPAAAKPVEKREPAAPLISKPRFIVSPYDSKGNLVRPWLVGSAAEFDIGTPEERIAAVPEDEKARIAAAYGATFKKQS